MSPFENNSEGPVSDEVLRVVLVITDDLHFPISGDGRRPSVFENVPSLTILDLSSVYKHDRENWPLAQGTVRRFVGPHREVGINTRWMSGESAVETSSVQRRASLVATSVS